MNYIPQIIFIDKKNTFSDKFTDYKELVVISFKHSINKGKFGQIPFIMIIREYYEDNKLTYAQVIWGSHCIIPTIRTFIKNQLPGLARILKLKPLEI